MVNDTFVCRHGCVVYTRVHMCTVVAASGDKRLALGHLPQLLLHFICGNRIPTLNFEFTTSARLAVYKA